MAKISVIIPTYGEPDRLEDAINSVLNQTYQDFEIMVIDDNNPESSARAKTAEIMNRLVSSDARVNYFCHDKNKNGSAARNAGIRKSKGQYLSFLDSDDQYAPERLEKCIKLIESKGDVKYKAVYTGCEFRRKGNTYHVETHMEDGNYLVQCLASTFNICSGSNIFVERQVVEELNGFDESFTRQQDIEFLVRYFERYSILGMKDVLVIKNQDGKNRPAPEKLEEIKKQFLETFDMAIKAQSQKNQDYIFSQHYQQIAEQYLSFGNMRKAKQYYSRVKQHHGYKIKCIIRKYCYIFKLLK